MRGRRQRRGVAGWRPSSVRSPETNPRGVCRGRKSGVPHRFRLLFGKLHLRIAQNLLRFLSAKRRVRHHPWRRTCTEEGYQHMARRIQSLAVAAAAVASTAAIVAAVPAAPSQAYTPTRLSTAKYELTALSDITIAGITNAFWQGYGGYIGSCCRRQRQSIRPEHDVHRRPGRRRRPYYGNSINGAVPVLPQRRQVGYQYNQSPVDASGVPGVLYYLSNNVINTFLPNFNLQNYYFEIAQAIGRGCPGAVLCRRQRVPRSLRRHGRQRHPERRVLRAVGVRLGDRLLPKINIGPIVVGGSILSSLYFYGATPDGSYTYSHAGYLGDPGLLQQLAGQRWSCRDCGRSGRGDQRQRRLDPRQGDGGDEHGDPEAARAGVGQRVRRSRRTRSPASSTSSSVTALTRSPLHRIGLQRRQRWSLRGQRRQRRSTAATAVTPASSSATAATAATGLRRTPLTTYVAATAGGNGGHGGFFFGNGGKGGSRRQR